MGVNSSYSFEKDPLPNLPPRGKERSFPPWGKEERGLRININTNFYGKIEYRITCNGRRSN
jgi:hypothetical protein